MDDASMASKLRHAIYLQLLDSTRSWCVLNIQKGKNLWIELQQQLIRKSNLTQFSVGSYDVVY